MTDEEMQITLGLLAQEARARTGQNRLQAVKEMGVAYRTLGGLEKAESKSIPARSSRRAIELHYGWRLGVIEDLWNRRREIPLGSLTEDDLLAEPGPEKTGLLKASHLTDEELMNELSFRFLMRDRRRECGHHDHE